MKPKEVKNRFECLLNQAKGRKYEDKNCRKYTEFSKGAFYDTGTAGRGFRGDCGSGL